MGISLCESSHIYYLKAWAIVKRSHTKPHIFKTTSHECNGWFYAMEEMAFSCYSNATEADRDQGNFGNWLQE